MDFSHYTDQPAQTAVDLVNTLEHHAGIEHLATADDLERFLATHAPDFCPPSGALSEADLHEVRAVRSRVRDVFDAEDDAAAASAVNGILADVGATPRLSLHGEAPHLHFEPTGATPARWLGAVTAMGLAVAIAEGGWDRLGVCGSTRCEDVYVDTSRNRSRRFCSDTCTTRENVAAYRRRRQVS